MRIFRKLMVFILIAVMLITSLLPLGIFAAETEISESEQDKFDLLREKYNMLLTAKGVSYSLDDPIISDFLVTLNANAAELYQSMNIGSDAEHLWDDTNESTSTHVTENYYRLKRMARAYGTYGCELYQNEELKNAIITGLDWMYENMYNESGTAEGNWWDWEVASPQSLEEAVIIMYDQLTEEQITNYMNAVDHFQNDEYYTGCNRSFQARVRALRGIIIKDSSEIEAAFDCMEPIFDYVKSGNGFYEDGSYLAHGSVAYNGGYGYVQIEYMTIFAWLFEGSEWEYGADKISMIHKYAALGMEPFMYNGNYMLMSTGRFLVHPERTESTIGSMALSTLALLSGLDGTGAELDYPSLIKRLAETNEDSLKPYYDNIDVTYMDVSLYELLKIREAAALGSSYTYESEYNHFPVVDKTVVQRDEWAFAISMYSERTMNYEYATGQNTKGWHLSDGVTYLYDSDLDKYGDAWLCTVDMYRLPGTTVAYKTKAAKSNNYGTYEKSLAGGAELGSIGMSVQRVYDDNIDAKKAWLVLDDKIVNFGAGITTTNGQVGETVIENLKINGDNALIINEAEQSSELGWSAVISDVSTLWIEGNTAGSDIGYYFPSRTTLNGIREARTGKWSQITNRDFTDDSTPITRNYLTIYQDHGVAENASYAYVTLPGYSAEEVAAYGENPTVEIIANNENVQAASDFSEGITGFVFWNNVGDGVTAETNTVDGLTAYNSAVVVREETDDTVKLAISDFSWRNDSVTLDYDLGEDHIVSEITSKSDNVKVLSLNPLRIEVDIEDIYGQTSYITLKKTSSEGADILEASVSALENYLTLSDFRAEEQTEISAIIAEGRTAMSSAEDINALQTCLVEYMNKLDAVPSDAEMTEAEINTCPGVKVDNEDSAVTKTGSWHTTENDMYYGGTASWTTSGSLEFTFTGSVISLMGAKTDDSGIFDIYIDGNLIETVDLYQALRPYDYQGILFRKTDLSYGEHTVKVVATKTKNEYATDYKIWFDSFVYSNIGHKYTSVVTAPSYTSRGYTTHTCICGDTYTDSYVDEIGGDVSHSGTLASGYDWMIITPGVLVISGSGEGTVAFESAPTVDDLSVIPWIEYAESITSVVIEESTGITGASAYAFAGLTNLASVTLPTTFADMSAEGLFAGDTALASITNHGNDTTEGVFDLRNVTKINASSFVGLTGSIWVGKNEGTEVDFGEVGSADTLAFVSYPTCDAADDIRAFIKASGSTAVTLSYYSAELDSTLTRSGANYLDDGTTVMFTWVFDDATGILTLTFTGESAGYKAIQGFGDWKDIWMDAVLSIRIEGKATYGKLQINKLGDDVRGPLNGYENLQSVIFVNKPGYGSSLCNEWAVNFNSFGLFSDNPKLTTVALGEVNLTEGVVDISNLNKVTGSNTLIGTFKNSSSVEKVVLPSISTFTSIGESMFEGCSSLSEVNIPETVTAIGANAFKNCSSLTMLHIPAAVTSVDPTAFEGCSELFITVEAAEMYNTLKGYGYNAVIDLRETAVADITIDLSAITVDITVLLATGTEENAIETYTADSLNSVFGEFANVTYYVYPTSNGATVVRELMQKNSGAVLKYYSEAHYSELVRSGSSCVNKSTDVGFVWSFDDESGRLTITNKIASASYSIAYSDFLLKWKPVWADAVYDIYVEGAITKILYNTGSHGIFDCYDNLWRIWFADDKFEVQNNTYATYGFFSDNPSLTTVGYGTEEPIEGIVNIEFIYKFTKSTCSQKLFRGCSSITKVNFRPTAPTNLTAITGEMFSGCSSLVTFALPLYIKSVAANAFEGCVALDKLILSNTALTVDSAAFDGARTKIVCFDEAQVDTINTVLESGTTEAEAILMNGAISPVGISIRYSEYNGLRYIFSFDNNEKEALEAAGFTLREYGVLFSAASNMDSASISADSTGKYVTMADRIMKAAVYDSTSSAEKGYCGRILASSTEDKIMFAGTVTNFDESNAKLGVYVRAYAVYFDADGNEYIYYSDYGDINENYRTASIFGVTYDMYKANAEGIREAEVDEKAVWNILLFGADIAEYREHELEGFEGITLTLVNNGEGSYLAFVRASDGIISEEATAAAKEKLASDGYTDIEVINVSIS